MRGVLFLGDRQAVVKEFPDPEPGLKQVRVGMKAASICGSDMHSYCYPAGEQGERAGLIRGHEACGIVDMLGEGVEGVRVGDRVMVHMSGGCGRCEYCLRGDDTYCLNAHSLGLRSHGSMADFVITGEHSCIGLPDWMSFSSAAVLVCAGGTAFKASRDLDVSGVDTVAIFGLGPVGLAGILMAKAMGARVIGIDVVAERLDIARSLNTDHIVDASAENPVDAVLGLTGGRGADVVLEYSGNPDAQKHSLECARKKGRVAWVGVNEGVVTISPSTILYKEVQLRGSLIFGPADAWQLFRFVEQHHLRFEALVSHRFPIERAPEALKLFDTRKTGKILFVWD
ncbi:MAG: zinc-binding dehydrogenase [Anaerolineales bacterium]